MKFYAIATNEKDQTFVVFKEETFIDRLTATQEAERICKMNDWTLKGVYQEGWKQKGGSAMTKFFKYRKQHNGENPKEYDSAL